MKLLRTMWQVRRLGGGLLVGLWGLTAGLLSQSSVRMWGSFCFDTRSLEVRCTKLAVATLNIAVLSSDGRIFVQGQQGPDFGALPCVVPAAPPGLAYVDLAQQSGYGLGLLNDGSVVGWGTAPWSPAYGVVPLPPVPPLPAGLHYTRIATGGVHVIFERSDGSFAAWCAPGSSNYGQGNVPAIPPGLFVSDFKASRFNSAFLLSDGTLMVWGYNLNGRCNVPVLPAGVIYTAVSLSEGDANGGGGHTLALRSDGWIEAFGTNLDGQCNVPALPPGTIYLMVAAGGQHSLALRSDGVLIAWGYNYDGQCNVPSLPPGVKCSQLVASYFNSAARLSDGSVLIWGHNASFNVELPSLMGPPGAQTLRYVEAAVGLYHGIFLLSDGTAQAFGNNGNGQCNVPLLPHGLSYVHAEASYYNTGALRSDGALVVWGFNFYGQCNVPPLPPGMSYVDFSMGFNHTVAVRSDGQAFGFGYNTSGQCNIPPLPPGVGYVAVDTSPWKTLLRRSDGLLVSTWTPGPPPALPQGLTYVEGSAGFSFDVGLRSDGTAVPWGPGLSSGLWVPIPPLPPGVTYVEADGGYHITTLRRSDGQVVVCGETPGGGWPAAYVPPLLDPGTSYVQLTSTHGNAGARVGPTCTYVSFAQGCAGSLPAARLVPRDTPRIGKTHQVTLFDLPMNIAIMVMGWQRFPSPISLSFLGMPGCAMHTSLDGTALLAGQGGQAKWFLPIPNQPSLVGLHFYNQALVFDPPANSFGAVVSDAAEGVIGHL